jgi:hypothetical protein
MNNNMHITDLDLVRRIRAVGIDIHIPEDDREATEASSTELAIYQEGHQIVNTVFDLHGPAAFIISAVITTLRPGIAISDFGLQLPWKATVQWLPDPREGDGPKGIYRFGTGSALEFQRNVVINHHADIRRRLPRGSSVRGLLLAWALEPIPDEIRHGTTFAGSLIVFDQYLHEHRSPIELWADRSQRCLRHTRSRATRRPLFDSLDPRSYDPSTQHRGVEVA